MRKNHSKIVCIKLVHLPYLYTYMMHGHTYIKLTLQVGMNIDRYNTGPPRTILLFECRNEV